MDARASTVPVRPSRLGPEVGRGRAADLTSRVTRATGRHGTALPGLVASRIDPAILSSLASDLDPVVLVIGTNGKTTTTP